MQWNIWRAPTDNDRNVQRQWMHKRYNFACARGYDVSLTHTETGWTLTQDYAIMAPSQPAVVRGKVQWQILANGQITMDTEAQRRPQDPFLPRFGLRLFLPKAMDQVTYFGYGPYESYIDKHQASFRNLYAANVHELHEDYLKPQENGSHYDCSFLSVASDACTLQVTGDSFSFNASPYTQEELTHKPHNFELEKAGCTVLCVDGATSGIGSNSCGPELAPEYQIPEDMHFSCTFSLLTR